MKIVAIKDMSIGNDSVGEMWKETKIFEPTDTLEKVILWAGDGKLPIKKNCVITSAEED